MYEYIFERVEIPINGWGALRGYRYETTEYRELIKKYGEQGWRYAGYIPAVQRGEGEIREIDLIFEREQKDGEKNV